MGKDDHQVNSVSQVAVNGFGSVSNPVAIATGRPKATRNQQVLCGVGFAKIDLARVVTKRVLYGEEVGTPNHLVGSYSSTVELDPDEEHNFAGTLQWESEPDIEQYLFTVELVYLDSIGGLEQAIGIDADNEVFNLQ